MFDDNDLGLDDEQEDKPQPKRRGRPKGSKNRPKEMVVTATKLQRLYDRFSPYMSDEQREYVQNVIDGKSPVDCLREMELIVRTMGLLFQEAATIEFMEGKVSMNLAKFADTLRASVKDLNDMRLQVEEQAQKRDAADDLVRLAQSRSSMERLEALMGETNA